MPCPNVNCTYKTSSLVWIVHIILEVRSPVKKVHGWCGRDQNMRKLWTMVTYVVGEYVEEAFSHGITQRYFVLDTYITTYFSVLLNIFLI